MVKIVPHYPSDWQTTDEGVASALEEVERELREAIRLEQVLRDDPTVALMELLGYGESLVSGQLVRCHQWLTRRLSLSLFSPLPLSLCLSVGVGVGVISGMRELEFGKVELLLFMPEAASSLQDLITLRNAELLQPGRRTRCGPTTTSTGHGSLLTSCPASPSPRAMRHVVSGTAALHRAKLAHGRLRGECCMADYSDACCLAPC